MAANLSNMTNDSAIDWNERDSEAALLLAPVVAYISVLMTSGVIGNSLVCYVCYKKWREKKMKYYIGFLATYDLITCCICMPMEIIMLRHPFLVGADALCKLQRFSRAVTSLAAGCILVIIAVDRYISICKHTRTRIQTSQAKKMCFASIMFSLMFSWPALILFGTMAREKHIIAETSCSVSQDYDGTYYAVIYYGIICVLFFGISISLIVFYSLVWFKIIHLPNLTSTISKRPSYSDSADLTNSNVLSLMNSDIVKKSNSCNTENIVPHQRLNTIERKKKGSCSSEKSKPDGSEDSCDLSTDWSRNSSVERDSMKCNFRCAEHRENSELIVDFKTDTTLPRTRTTTIDRTKASSRKYSFIGSLSSRMSSKSFARRRRITITMFVITTVQVLSFVPYITLLICRSFIHNFVNSFNVSAQVAYNIGILSHFLSSGINPFIYGFCSEIFRREFKKVVCKKFSKMHVFINNHHSPAF